MRVDELFWHDGNITFFGIKGNPPRTAILRCSLYANGDARKRDDYQLEFKNVSCVLLSADIDEMKRNIFAGCISDGVAIDLDGAIRVRLSLTGGDLEICCENASVSPSPKKRASNHTR
jgi:hypothetical protein